MTYQCHMCVARGKTWSGSDPKCAFLADGTFTADNWGLRVDAVAARERPLHEPQRGRLLAVRDEDLPARLRGRVRGVQLLQVERLHSGCHVHERRHVPADVAVRHATTFLQHLAGPPPARNPATPPSGR